MSETFKVKINGGTEHDFTCSTGMYQYAAVAAVLADDNLLPLPKWPEFVHVEIWSPTLVPEYGPYRYLIHQDERQSIHIGMDLRN